MINNVTLILWKLKYSEHINIFEFRSSHEYYYILYQYAILFATRNET